MSVVHFELEFSYPFARALVLIDDDGCLPVPPFRGIKQRREWENVT